MREIPIFEARRRHAEEVHRCYAKLDARFAASVLEQLCGPMGCVPGQGRLAAETCGVELVTSGGIGVFMPSDARAVRR